jgi:zinc/manganese transport system substrate-binding protein
MPKISFLALAVLAPSLAAADLRVVTTTEGLAAIVREIAADAARVESLARGGQDPHFVDANPALAVKLRNAHLLVDVGLDLEAGWLPALVLQSRNAEIQPGGRRRLTAADAVAVLDAPAGPVDRSRGDLHPAGNPHFLADPRRALRVAAAVAERLAALDPPGAPTYRARAAAFEGRIQAALARWQATLAPVRGRKLYTHHRTLSYFLDWSGLVSAGELEPRPGVPPSPAHLAALVAQAKREGIAAIVVETHYDRKSAEVVAKHSGARVVTIPGDVGAEPEIRTYEDYVTALVTRIAGALA